MEREQYQLVGREDSFLPPTPERLHQTRLDLLAVEAQGPESTTRDAALWAVMPTLRADESLTLRYVLGQDTDAYISLGLHHDASREDVESFMARRDTLVRAATVALPEFAAVDPRSWKPMRYVDITPCRLSTHAAAFAWRDRSPRPRRPHLADVFLSARPLAAMDLSLIHI